MKACASCPNRHMADLFDALGSAEKAAEIRAAGCEWWWGIPEEEERDGLKTGQVRNRETCGVAYLPSFLRAYGTDIVRAANCVQDDREEQQKALAALDDSLTAIGVPETVALLAQVGLRTAISQRQLAARNETEDSNGNP